MSITWLKLHHDIIHDIKLRKFTPQEKWAWVTLLVLASENSDRGNIEADDEDLADICEFNSTQDWLYFKDKLRSKGMVEQTPSGIKVANWEKRQYSSPSDKPEATRERKRKQRAKSKPDETPPPPQGHEHVTSMSRDVTPQIQIQSIDPDQKRVDLDPVLPLYSCDAQAQEENWRRGEGIEPTPVFVEQERPDSSFEILPSINQSGLSRQTLHSSPSTVPLAPPSPNVLNFQSKAWHEWQTGPGPNDYVPEFVDYLAQKWGREKADVKRFFQKNRSNPEAIAVYFEDFKSSKGDFDGIVMNVLRKKFEERHGRAANW